MARQTIIAEPERQRMAGVDPGVEDGARDLHFRIPGGDVLITGRRRRVRFRGLKLGDGRAGKLVVDRPPGGVAGCDQRAAAAHPASQSFRKVIAQPVQSAMGQDDMRVSAQISAAEFGLIDHADRHVHVMIEEVPDFPGIARADAAPGHQQHFGLLHIGEGEAAKV